MTESRIAPTFAFRVASRVFSSSTAFLAAAAIFVPTVQATAQQTQSPPIGRVIVIGQRDTRLRTDRERCDYQGQERQRGDGC